MFSNNQRKSPDGGHARETSLIAQGTSIKGDVHFSGALHLDGKVDGSVLADADSGAVFTLSEDGQVTGEVRVPCAVVNGVVKGNIHAADRLELAARARVDGDVHYRVLEMAAGAEVNGRMVHQGAQAQRQLAGPDTRGSAAAEDLQDTAAVALAK